MSDGPRPALTMVTGRGGADGGNNETAAGQVSRSPAVISRAQLSINTRRDETDQQDPGK